MLSPLSKPPIKSTLIIVSSMSFIFFLYSFHNIVSIDLHHQLRSSSGEDFRGVDIIIVGQARSGTSFLGELLNQHPLVLYIFEPLFSKLLQNIFYDEEGREYQDETTSIMEGFLSCNFAGKTKHLQQFSKSRTRYLSRALTNYSRTSPILFENFENICKNFSYRAIKVLSGRLSNLSLLSLEKLVKNGLARGRQVKIVHLLRDPRAVVHSWTRYRWIPDNPDPSFYRNAKQICEPLKKNLKLRRNLPKWLRNRYKFVRYEEMVSKPIKVAQEIYSFLDIEIAPEVIQWIESRKKVPSQKDIENRHSTIRNTTFTINNWKNKLSKEKRRAVETACSEVLEQLTLERSLFSIRKI